MALPFHVPAEITPLMPICSALLPTVNAAFGTVVPMPTLLEKVAPAAVMVPVRVGEADSTTLPVPVGAVVQAMAEKKVHQETRHQRNLKRNLSLETEVHEDSDMAGPHPATRLPTPSAMAIFEEEYDRLVENQTGTTRAVAQLRYEGNSFVEIAQCLDLDEATARRRIREIKRSESSVDPSNSDN